MLKQNKWTKIRISVITVWLWNIQDAIETSFMVRVNSYIQFGKNSKIPSLLSAKWLNSLTSVWSIKKCIYIAHLLKILNFKFCKVAFYASLFFHVFSSSFISQLSCKQKKINMCFCTIFEGILGRQGRYVQSICRQTQRQTEQKSVHIWSKYRETKILQRGIWQVYKM